MVVSHPHGDPVTVECGQGVLQPDSELAHDLIYVGQLLFVLVLGQVLVAKPAAPVADMPAPVVVPEDQRFRGAGESLLIERAGNRRDCRGRCPIGAPSGTQRLS